MAKNPKLSKTPKQSGSKLPLFNKQNPSKGNQGQGKKKGEIKLPKGGKK